jgi:arsenite methyltransferase
MTTPNQNSGSHTSSAGHAFTASAWLDLHFLAMQPEYEEMLRWVGIQPGWHVLDAACGNGSFLPLMTELVGPDGQVTAVDLAPENVQVVEARASQSQWPAPVSTRVGNILNLPYENQTFYAVWCANTTQYLSDAEVQQAFNEFRRVVRPGGLIAIKEYDITAQQFQPAPPTLAWRRYEAMHRTGDQNSQSLFRAIQLPQWLRAAGLQDIRQKPTLMVRFYPLRDVEKLLICEALKYFYVQAQQTDLPPEELQIWQQLADVDSADHITNHPDFQYRAIQTVFVGRVP